MNGTNTGVCTCHQTTTGPCAVHGPSWAWQNERYLPMAPQGTIRQAGHCITLSNEPPVSSSPPVSQAGNAELSSSPEDSPEGRSSCTGDNADEAATVNIPLAVQLSIFEMAHEQAFSIIRRLLKSDRGTLYRLAENRLVDGFEEYGSAMYDWDSERRLAEVLEELADAIVYLTSGPIE